LNQACARSRNEAVTSCGAIAFTSLDLLEIRPPPKSTAEATRSPAKRDVRGLEPTPHQLPRRQPFGVHDLLKHLAFAFAQTKLEPHRALRELRPTRLPRHTRLSGQLFGTRHLRSITYATRIFPARQKILPLVESFSSMKTTRPITIESMQAAICRFIVAQGPHMPEGWKQFLVAECGLAEHTLVQHPMVPRETRETRKQGA